MRPDENDLNDELRGHLAIEIKQRIDRGEDPESARRLPSNWSAGESSLRAVERRR